MFKKIGIYLVVVLGLTYANGVLAQENAQMQDQQRYEMMHNPAYACVNGRDAYGYIGDAACGGGNSPNNSGGGGGRTVIVDKWGAIAFDHSRNSYGYSVGLSTRADAEQSAISDCGGGSCKTLSTFKNSCAALAGGRNRSGGAFVLSKWHLNNPKIAEQLALTACSKKAKNCQILVSECSLP